MRPLGLSASEIAGLMRPLDPIDDGPGDDGPGDSSPSRRDADDPGVMADRFARAAWSCVAEPGDGTAGALVAALGPASALRALIDDDVERMRGAAADAGEPLGDDELRAALERWRPRLRQETVVRALTQARRFAVRLIAPGSSAWPEGLDDLGRHAPFALWLRGREEVLRSAGASIAIVGARAATGYGEHVAVEAAAGIVDRGYAVISGAAYGIDGVAHRSALASDGDTIAVMAGGVDRFYPAGNEALIGRIAERGAVVAEVPCGAAPSKWRFLQRNRLIAAASLATVVVEAGWRSGSLNTAGHAAALGRPLGAVPGPVTSTASAGCHRLLREYGAVCVTNAEEMVELAPLPDRARGSSGRDGLAEGVPGPGARIGRAETTAGRDPEGARLRLLDAMSARSARPVEVLARESGLGADRVRAELGLLELEGRVRDRGHGWTKAGG